MKHKKNSVIVLEQAMLKSAVWIGLSGTSKAIFCLFRCKCRYENFQGRKHSRRVPDLANNGRLVFTYDEAHKKYGIGASRFRRGIDNLIAMGFLDVTETGMGLFKSTTYYAMSDRWRDYDTADFVEAKRPKRNNGRPGFKRGNKMNERRRKTKSTVVFAHGTTVVFDSGSVKAMYTNDSGEKVTNSYKWSNNKWLAS